MAFSLTTTREAAQLNGIKCLVYGKPGMGKTSLCATAPNPLIISNESGLLSLKDYDIPVVQVSTFEQLDEVHSWLLNGGEDTLQYETICLDSISEIAEVVLNSAKKNVKDPRQAYGVLNETMADLIRQFRDLPGRNVYFTAKQILNEDQHTGVVTYGPSMPGKTLTQQLSYYFDEVFKLTIGKTPEGEEYRYLQTKPDIQNEAKDRSGALDPIEYPDLTNIFNKIRGA